MSQQEEVQEKNQDQVLAEIQGDHLGEEEGEGYDQGNGKNLGQFEKEKQDEINQQNEEDKRSIFVQNVEYNTTKEELVEIFKDCGEIEKLLFLKVGKEQEKDKISVELAKALSDSIHRGRAIKVLPKRTNQHGFKKKSFKPNGFIKQFPYMKNNLMKGFMFGGVGYPRKKNFNPH